MTTSTSAPVTDTNRFDNFLYGIALVNHATYLQSNWDPGVGCVTKVIAYIAGVGEHILYMLFKVVTLVSFFFINIALTLHYLAAYAQKADEAEITTRKIRLMVGLLVLGETLPGICIDTVGVMCPPLAYQAHKCVKERVTRRYFEKWGIVDHSMTKEEFSSLNFFAKM